MTKKNISETPKVENTKYEYIIDYGDLIQIWRYDKKHGKNAYEVENIYKGEPKFSKLKKGSK